MYTYKLKIKKVSGRLNESVLPSKNLVIKSNKSLSKKAILKEANAYFKKKYGLTVESLEIWDKDDLSVLENILRKTYEKWGRPSAEGRRSKDTLNFVIKLTRKFYEEFTNSGYSTRMHRTEDDYDNVYGPEEYYDRDLLHSQIGNVSKINNEVRKFIKRMPKGRVYDFSWLDYIDFKTIKNAHIDSELKNIFYVIQQELRTFYVSDEEDVYYDSHTQIDDIRGINDMY